MILVLLPASRVVQCKASNAPFLPPFLLWRLIFLTLSGLGVQDKEGRIRRETAVVEEEKVAAPPTLPLWDHDGRERGRQIFSHLLFFSGSRGQWKLGFPDHGGEHPRVVIVGWKLPPDCDQRKRQRKKTCEISRDSARKSCSDSRIRHLFTCPKKEKRFLCHFFNGEFHGGLDFSSLGRTERGGNSILLPLDDHCKVRHNKRVLQPFSFRRGLKNGRNCQAGPN